MAIDILVTPEPLAMQPAALRADAGAVIDFLGVVREQEGERKICGLEYEAHQTMAEHQLAILAEAALERFGLAEVTIHHRTGFVAIAEASLFLRIQSGHRGEALDACRWIIEELKRVVPIWKKPVWAD